MRNLVSVVRYIVDIAANFIYLKLYKRIDSIASSTAYSDLHALYLLARDGRGDGVIAEVGAYHGKSTVVLALGSSAGRREKVVSIDPHTPETKKIFFDNIRKMGVEDRVIPVIATSEDARKDFYDKIRLMFIDGDHSYESAKKDVALWKDLVIDGGVIVFHDLNWKSVFKALEEFVMRSPEFIIEGTVGCSLMVSKGSSKSKPVFDEIHFFNDLKKALRPWKGEAPEDRIIPNYLMKS